MCGNGEPTAGGSALWKIHLQAFRHFEHGNREITETATQSFFNIPLFPSQEAALAMRRACAQLTLHNFGFVSG